MWQEETEEEEAVVHNQFATQQLIFESDKRWLSVGDLDLIMTSVCVCVRACNNAELLLLLLLS